MILPTIIGFFLTNEEILDIFGEKYESIFKNHNVLYSFKGNGYALGVLKSPQVDASCRPREESDFDRDFNQTSLADLKKFVDRYPILKSKNIGYFIL